MNTPGPVNTSNRSKETSWKSTLRVVVHSFFVVPFLIAVFAVLVFLMVRILTMEPRTAEDYLTDVKIGGATKRWQGAFELSKILANSSGIPRSERFQEEMKAVFEHSRYEKDARIRTYLALAMGRTGDWAYTDILVDALQDEQEDVVAASVHALGIIRDPKSRMVLIDILSHPSSKIRLQGVIALGNLGGEEVLPSLRVALRDLEPNVRWDAAVALAKLSDISGKRILLDLLDRNYLDSHPEVDAHEQSQAMLVAIQASEFIIDDDIVEALIFLRDHDPNVKVQEAARRVIINVNQN